MPKSSDSPSSNQGLGLKAIVAKFNKSRLDYVNWCADNDLGPSRDSSVEAFLLAGNW